MKPVLLNLLSPEKRRFLEWLIYIQFIRNTAETAVLFIAMSAITLLGGNIILQDHLNALSENLTAISTQQSGKNQQLRHINAVLRQTEKLQKSYVLWSEKINIIAASVPNGVALSSFSMDFTGKQVLFAGTAKTRENLLLFQKNLQSAPIVESAIIPITQLTGRENLSFSFTAVTK